MHCAAIFRTLRLDVARPLNVDTREPVLEGRGEQKRLERRAAAGGCAWRLIATRDNRVRHEREVSPLADPSPRRCLKLRFVNRAPVRYRPLGRVLQVGDE